MAFVAGLAAKGSRQLLSGRHSRRMNPRKWGKWEMSVNKLLYNIAKSGVRALAQNPELRAKTMSFVKDQVVPQAKAGWEKAKPGLDQAKDTAVGAAKDVADVARENDPREDPKKFLSEASQRLRDRAKL